MALLAHLTIVLVALCSSGQSVVVYNYYDKMLIGNLSIKQELDNNLGRISKPPMFYVRTPTCEMPLMETYSPEIRSLSQSKHKTGSCKAPQKLVSVKWNPTQSQYELLVNRHEEINTECHYQAIIRNEENAKYADKEVILKKNVPFKDKQLVPVDVQGMLIDCELSSNGSYITDLTRVEDAFAFVQPQPHVGRSVRRQPSVLILGIDSMSRANLRRSLPRVSKFLLGSGWHEMQGFNKVGDNTLPNMLATLTGYMPEGASVEYCNVHNLTDVGCLDRLPFVWKDFKIAGYRTALAEDTTPINTFSSWLLGFRQAPVDYYMRPFMIALEDRLPISKISDLNECIGHRPGIQYIYDYCVQFLERHLRLQPFFGLFWTNSYATANYKGPSDYDKFLDNYLRKFEKLGLYEEAIVIVMSDHGNRFGNINQLSTGYLEERLPLLFISLPPWFRTQHPGFESALRINRNRLSSHYDLHMTLQHLAQLQHSTDSQILIPTSDCPRCQSLLYELPIERTCQDAGIKAHWCACEPYEKLPLSDFLQSIGHYVVKRINKFLKTLNLSHICTPLRLSGILQAQRKRRMPQDEDDGRTLYRIRVEALPNKVVFEATVIHDELTQTMDMDIDMSRLNSFRRDSICIKVKQAKKFCVCHNSIKIN